MNSLEYLWKISTGVLIALLCTSFSYRVVPIVTLNGRTNGAISSYEFSQYKCLNIDTLNHSCIVSKYTLYHISLTKDVEVFKGTKANFSSPIQAAVHIAERGDKYIFINVMVQCNGDKTPVIVNPLSFNIR